MDCHARAHAPLPPVATSADSGGRRLFDLLTRRIGIRKKQGTVAALPNEFARPCLGLRPPLQILSCNGGRELKFVPVIGVPGQAVFRERLLRLCRSGGEFIQIKGVGRLRVAEDEEPVAREIETDESRAAADDEGREPLAGVEILERDLARQILDGELILLRVERRVAAEKAVAQIAAFDRINQHAVFRILQHQPVALR